MIYADEYDQQGVGREKGNIGHLAHDDNQNTEQFDTYTRFVSACNARVSFSLSFSFDNSYTLISLYSAGPMRIKYALPKWFSTFVCAVSQL